MKSTMLTPAEGLRSYRIISSTFWSFTPILKQTTNSILHPGIESTRVIVKITVIEENCINSHVWLIAIVN